MPPGQKGDCVQAHRLIWSDRLARSLFDYFLRRGYAAFLLAKEASIEVQRFSFGESAGVVNVAACDLRRVLLEACLRAGIAARAMTVEQQGDDCLLTR